MKDIKPAKVLFVCLGNICRSPLAQAYFQNLVNQENAQDLIEVSSSGFSPNLEGMNYHPLTVKLCKKENLPLKGKSRPTTLDDLKKFDYILAMDEKNFRDLIALDQQKIAKRKIKLLCSYLEEDDAPIFVPDPYYGGEQDFRDSFEIIKAACDKLWEELKKTKP